MNKNRRKRLASIANQLSVLIDKAQEILDEEQEAFDNMPENFKQVERSEIMGDFDEAIYGLINGMEGAKDSIKEFISDEIGNT